MKGRILATVAALGCLAVPVAADIFRPSISQQIELGKEAAAQIRKEEKVLPDSDPRVKELRRLGKLAIAQISEKERKDKPFEYTFDVIESNELNAFALPGGPIFFYTGLLDKLKTEDAVMGILSHEITHIRNQHWASAYADNLKRKLGLMVVLTLLQANTDILNAADMLDSILVGLPYSRSHESEADNFGYEMMVAAGYNPQGMVDVFKVLAAQGGSGTPEFLSTHPDTQKRIESLQNKIKADKRKFPAMKKRKALLASTDTGITWDAGWPTIGTSSSGKTGGPLQKGGGLAPVQSR